jgi:hypothetical protein
LKVCSTCHYWFYTHKGLCARLNQGVGKFWLCENWLAADDRLLPAAPGGEAPHPPSP